MDQVKIGKFIAAERKQNSYTQKQLADKLNISDKTISKWECGNGFPEISLLLPLCTELHISVNELLSGERLSDSDYKRKAEEHMVDFMKEKEENTKKMQLVVILGVISLLSFLTILIISILYADVIIFPVKIAIVIISCIIFTTGFYVTIQGERKIGYYKCKHCGETFVPSFGSYMKGVHMFSSRWLECPNCKKKSWAQKTMSRE